MSSRVSIGVLALLVSAAGCDDLQVETFVASRWDAGRECLEEAGVVDVVDDDDPAACDDQPRCWLSPEGDLYATTECEGPPGWEQTSIDGDDRCEDAVEAFAAGAEGRCDAG